MSERIRAFLYAPDWTRTRLAAAGLAAGLTPAEVQAVELYVDGFRQISRAHGRVARCPRPTTGWADAEYCRRVEAKGDDVRRVSDEVLTALRRIDP